MLLHCDCDMPKLFSPRPEAETEEVQHFLHIISPIIKLSDDATTINNRDITKSKAFSQSRLPETTVSRFWRGIDMFFTIPLKSDNLLCERVTATGSPVFKSGNKKFQVEHPQVNLAGVLKIIM
ncbi:hypothetical protein CRM22_001561 [Opisthorchis felineus]|uniref:Uncharacterized protein n=1 Tax=Opisthorchis felineus TaxID=147828 RepID=A0A4S2MFZ6_OPIFE|nr:hypothetical protein CRM22_001561 [Opisthorchis felineus]